MFDILYYSYEDGAVCKLKIVNNVLFYFTDRAASRTRLFEFSQLLLFRFTNIVVVLVNFVAFKSQRFFGKFASRTCNNYRFSYNIRILASYVHVGITSVADPVVFIGITSILVEDLVLFI